MLDAKIVVKKAEEANLIDDILYAVYKINSNDYYDAAILAPSWLPEKIFTSGATVTKLSNGSYNSSYEVLTNGLKLAYIQSGSGASTVLDALLCLTKSKIKTIFFVGTVGSIHKDITMSTIATPREFISYDGVSAFMEDKITNDKLGITIKPYNMEYIDSIITKANSNGIKIVKEKTFITNSILLEYSHMDEILATGSKLIEMETAGFYKGLEMMNKDGMAILVVSDNSQDKKSLICKDPNDRIRYEISRGKTVENVIRLALGKEILC